MSCYSCLVSDTNVPELHYILCKMLQNET